MARPTKPKRGRPRMRETTTTFGMKLSPRERDLIRSRAARTGKSASRYILDLVHQAEASHATESQTPRPLSGKEFLALPIAERRRRLKRAAEIAARHNDYAPGSDLLFDAEEPYHAY